MKLSRRTILKLTGATGAIGLASGSAGIAAASDAARAELSVGEGPYVLTHDGRILARSNNYHDAVRQAGELRQSMQAPIAHRRCSADLWRMLGDHPDALWHEVDGLAVTPQEMEERAFEFLRRAKDPDAARATLWKHHGEALWEDVAWRLQSRDDLACYVMRDGAMEAVVRSADINSDRRPALEDGQTLFSCTPRLADDLEAYLATPGSEPPSIATVFPVHMTAQEHAEAVEHDPFFAAAADRRAEVRLGAATVPGGPSLRQPVEKHLSALAIPVTTEAPEEVEAVTARLSPWLAEALRRNGIMFAGFWREIDGVLRHLDEFADYAPQSSLSGRPIRHQNRHV
ncbi:MAG: hypothetical protein AAFZ01_04885 [Pseudomonadota bacterium]